MHLLHGNQRFRPVRLAHPGACLLISALQPPRLGPSPLRRRNDPRPPLGAQAALLLGGLRRCRRHCPAATFRATAQRFFSAAATRRRAAGLTMRLSASSRANATVLSWPRGPVMRTRTPHLKGSAAIRPSYGSARRCPAASTAASMRSRWAAENPPPHEPDYSG